MVYCHPGVEQPDDEPPELDDHQRTAGRNASQTMELPEASGTAQSRWRAPDV